LTFDVDQTRHKSKTKALLRSIAFALLAAAASGQLTYGQSDPQSEYQANLVRTKGRLASTTALAQKVEEIANSATISTDKKKKRISTAVRIAVVAATAYKDDPDAVLGIAIQMAEAAARAAPHFTEEISNAIAFSPSVSRIEGAQNRIRTAAFAAARGPRNRRARSHELAVSPPPAENAEETVSPEAEAPRRTRTAAPPVEAQSRPTEQGLTASENAAGTEAVETPSDQMQGEAVPGDENETQVSRSRSAPSKIFKGENSKLTATANIGVQHDDNVYFANSNKVSDTIYSIQPGLSYAYGQKTVDHGSIFYEENFLRYARHSAPNVDLGTAGADFNYDDGGMLLTAIGSYQQLFQNNIDTLTLGQPQALFRSTVYSLAGTGEFQLGGKTSASAGVTYSHVSYQLPTLLSSEDIAFPVDVYYKLTPKLDLSVGYTYGVFRPQGAGPDAKDGYANVGARGEFTSKLAGTVSVGYITRTYGNSGSTPSSVPNQASHGLGFTGNLSYDLTPKTVANLTVARSFSASALAQTTTNSSYTLGVTTDLSSQWKIGEAISEQIVNYGPQVFFVQNTLPTGNRKDSLATANIYLTYIYSRWLSGSLAYTFRNDHSTISAIDFSDDVFGLSLNLSY